MISHDRWRVVEAMEERYTIEIEGEKLGEIEGEKLGERENAKVCLFCLAYWSGEMARSLEHTRRIWSN
jgi:hypothetical protein